MSSRVFSFHYTLKDTDGETLDSSVGDEPMVFMEGAGQIISGLEKALLGLQVGDKKTVPVQAVDAYGERNEEWVFEVPRKEFPKKDVEIGDQFQVDFKEGPQVVTVVEVADEAVTLDANHPLAGQDLVFDVEMIEIRQATEEEVAHGHAHGRHGHSH